VALQAHCSKAHRAVVISNRNCLRSLGGAIGLVISAVTLQNKLKADLPEDFKHLALSTYSTPDLSMVSVDTRNKVLDAYAHASKTVFILNVPFIALCLLGCILVKDNGLARKEEVTVEKELPLARYPVVVVQKENKQSTSKEGASKSSSVEAADQQTPLRVEKLRNLD